MAMVETGAPAAPEMTREQRQARVRERARQVSAQVGDLAERAARLGLRPDEVAALQFCRETMGASFPPAPAQAGGPS